MQEILDKLDEIHTSIQTLDIKPTRTNMEKLLKALYFLEEVFQKLSEKEGNDGKTTDAE